MPRILLSYSEAQAEIFFPANPVRYTAVPKGRRSGGTRGAAHACIEWAMDGMPILWGDTVRANISAYVDRYFLPPLKRHGVAHKWEERHNLLRIGDNGGYIDLRSADQPENWEGQGYRKIVLNEAGIILKDRNLYVKTVLPMLMDFPNSELFAIGTPKGKVLKDGKEHPFYTIAKKGMDGAAGYRTVTMTSRDNPYLMRSDIDELTEEIRNMEPGLERQEIDGLFIDQAAGRPFTWAFDINRHRGKAQRRPGEPVYFSIDFNVEPFVGIAAHIWQDSAGWHYHRFSEAKLKVASIEAMRDWILSQCPQRHLINITGDRNGMSRSIGLKGPVRLFVELARALGIGFEAQFRVSANPSHLVSRQETNMVFLAVPPVMDNVIDDSCTGLLNDHALVEVDADGGIVKANRSKAAQRADHLDCDRYLITTYLRPWLKQQQHGMRSDQSEAA